MPSPRTTRDLLFIHTCGPKASQLARDDARPEAPAPPSPAELAPRLDLLERDLLDFFERLVELQKLVRGRR
jgi:hypothetical protein